ncbi:amidohydrolase family protein [Variovorax sp.]|uniref:amidohydrolase family protein n=1 Tax=Variovorax sp. TaxID=1871043 RepID=UPI002D4D9426|nr:amidohydrolase family protein [Variovorax sp.]HYP84282.1 amidohydrolase family protein [Variovorax sp.]
MASRILIRHAQAVLTGLCGDAARSSATDLRIADGVLTEMGRGLKPGEGEQVLDAGDCVVYPGWVNTHHHLFQSLLKGVPAGINLTLSPWLQAVPFALRRGFDEKRLRLAARIGLVELLRSGCTTVADHHYLFQAGAAHDAAALLFEEADALGLRFMLLRGGATVTRRLEDSERLQQAPETLDEMLASVQRTAARYHQCGPMARTRVALAPTSAHVSLRRDELRAAARAARAMGLPLHSHMSESVAYFEYCREMFGCLPIEYLAEQEWLGPDVWLAHLVHLTPGEMRLLGDTGTGIAHCPQSNARLADGIAAAPALERLGATVSIGVDGAASNEAADMLSELHFAWLVHRARAGAQAVARPEGEGEAGADVVTVEQLVHWASAGGAKVLGFDGVGTLQVGQAADLAVWRLDDPRYFGLHDPAIGPVVGGGRPRLRWLLCGGEVIAQDDAIPGLDLAQLQAQAREAVHALMRGA